MKTLYGVLFISLVIIGNVKCDDFPHQKGMCTFSGTCGYNVNLTNSDKRGSIPCYQSKPSFPPEDLDHIREVCPNLVAENPEDTRVCCQDSQVTVLEEQISASDLLFGRCPSCFANFRNLYCYITCSPDQSSFVDVTETIQNDGYTFPSVVDEIIYIDREFSKGFHTSCKEVIFPQTNGKAMTLSCNGYTGDQCTTQHFLDYLGSTNNGVAPLDMDFRQIGNVSESEDVIASAPDPFIPFLPTLYGCDEAPNNLSLPCSCSDCSASCPAPPPIPKEVERFEIGNADGVGVIMLIIFLVLSVLFVASSVAYCICCKDSKPKYINFSQDELDKRNHRPPIRADELSYFEKLAKSSQDFTRRILQRWGLFVAHYPYLVIILSVGTIAALCVGIQWIILTTDPIELWSTEGSKVRNEKDFFDEKFGKFYRTEQLIMRLKPEFDDGGYDEYTSYANIKYNFSKILRKEYMLELLELHDDLRYMRVNYTDDNGDVAEGGLQDICFKPLAPDNNNCTITSVMGYWQNDPNQLNKEVNVTDKIYGYEITVDYRDHFLYCVEAPATLQETTPLKQPCTADFGGPVFPYLAVGGQEGKEYNKPKALILNYVVLNFEKDDYRSRIVTAWEKEFLRRVSEWNTTHFEYTYFSERSVEDELTRSSQSDITVFVISYLVIFVYIALALGSYSSLRRVPVESKITLGIVGILVILASVFAALGILGYARYATSLIVIEVVPFLVLAIGADNVFILTLEYDRDKRREGETVEQQIGRVFGEVGPSMLICSMTETTAFFLGALTDMPAVEQFAYASAIAIFLDFVLQITLFLSVLTLNAKREDQNRVDGLCCIKMSPKKDKDKEKDGSSMLDSFFEKYYTPFLMNDLVRVIVMLGFFGVFCWCIALSTRITIGLDQDLSVPLDSYVLDYFDFMELYLGVGVPVYFVTKGGYDFSNIDGSNAICATAGCNNYSLVQQITFANKNPEYWKIETPAASWLDDYEDWLRPFGPLSCCKEELPSGDFCPSTSSSRKCKQCLMKEGEYTDEQYYKYLPWFMTDNPSLSCNKGGHSAYGGAINLDKINNTDATDRVDATYFMSYHSVCIKSEDCTTNLKRGRAIADNITNTIKELNRKAEVKFLHNEDEFEVYPYCLYYVYYEQYLTMVDVTLYQLGICLIPTFAFVFILLGFNLQSGIITLMTILMIVVDTAGLSSLWGVDLNPVSLINLVAAIGLSVEFTSHVVRTFSLQTQPTRKERVISAMKTMGPAVFAGVALTNLPGIIVLNWATAQLIQVFFFRMCLIITLLGTAHGLIFLPVLLSYIGPPLNKAILYEKQQEERRRVAKEAANMQHKKKKPDEEIKEHAYTTYI